LDRFKEEFDLKSAVFVSWGDYDRKQLKRDCNYHNIPYPFDNEHINVKKLVANHLNFPKPKGIGETLHSLNLEFVGTPHREIDDVKNIIHILQNI
jgi:inhibitor of KinA sporulation pathway (predicted exonuclease)